MFLYIHFYFLPFLHLCILFPFYVSFYYKCPYFCHFNSLVCSSISVLCVCVSSVLQVLKLPKLLYPWPGFNEHCDIWTFLLATHCLPRTSAAEKGVMVLERGKGLF